MDCFVGMSETVVVVLYVCQSSRLRATSARPGTLAETGMIQRDG